MVRAKISRLSDSEPGERFRIAKLEINDDIMKRRLLDLGFVPGCEVMVLQKSPLGDPTAYRVCNTTIALRKEESDHIYGERIYDDNE